MENLWFISNSNGNEYNYVHNLCRSNGEITSITLLNFMLSVYLFLVFPKIISFKIESAFVISK